MNRDGEVFMAWCGPIGLTIFAIAWVLMLGWLFPPPPSLDAGGIVDVYVNNLSGIRLGVILVMFGGTLTLPYGAAIMMAMLRMKGPSPALAYTQFGLMAIQVLIFIIPAAVWGAVAFRPERMNEISQFGNDVAWLMFDGIVCLAMVQFCVIGYATLKDRSDTPVFPRWFGYYNIWSAMLLIPNNIILFFKTGPFAWNGVLGWWLGAISFTIWFFISFWPVLNAMKAGQSPEHE